jgi:hypothetical protein
MTYPYLPQEIIYEILSNLPTRSLCTLLTTSKSTYLDVTGILHSRLETHLLSKGDHKLIVTNPPIISNIQFEAFLPSDQRSVPYHLSTYTHTSPESPNFTATLYSYFSLTPNNEDSVSWPGRMQFPVPSRAMYSFNLSPDDPWAQLALQGNLVKLSPNKPGIFKAIVPCFERRDFIRLKKVRLNELAEADEGEMIWVNERREVGVWTTVLDRAVLNMEEEFGRELRSDRGVPMYTRQMEGTVRYTLGFEYLAMKTG